MNNADLRVVRRYLKNVNRNLHDPVPEAEIVGLPPPKAPKNPRFTLRAEITNIGEENSEFKLQDERKNRGEEGEEDDPEDLNLQQKALKLSRE